MNSKPHHKIVPDVEAPVFTRRYLWMIAGITALLGIWLALLPSVVASMFFHSASHDINFFVRMLGSTLFGYGALNAIAAHDATHRVCRVAVWSNLATLLSASIISICYYSFFTGFGWLVVGQHVIFAGGFIYCARELARQKI